MAKDPIDNGNAINVADVYENQNIEVVPSALPVTVGTLPIDGDQTTGTSIANTISVDLKYLNTLKKLKIPTSGIFISYQVWISYRDTDNEDEVDYIEITSGCSLSNNVITYEPTNAFVCRWVKVKLTLKSEV